MKTCIVLEGGASRGYFTMGVLDFLLEKKLYIDHAYGTSMGALNAVSYLSRQKGRLIEISKASVNDSKLYTVKGLVKEGDPFSWDYLENDIFAKKYPLDLQEFQNGKTCIVTLTNCQSGECELKDITKEKNYQLYLRATTALPPVFKEVKIDDNVYLDGGITKPLPYEMALKEYEKIVVVRTREKKYRKLNAPLSPVVKQAIKKYPKLIDDFNQRSNEYNREVEELIDLASKKRVFIIYPNKPINLPTICHDPKKVMSLYKSGYDIAKTVYDDLVTYLNK